MPLTPIFGFIFFFPTKGESYQQVMERKRKREQEKKLKDGGGGGGQVEEVVHEPYDYSKHVQMSLDYCLPGLNYQLFVDNLALGDGNGKEGIMGTASSRH